MRFLADTNIFVYAVDQRDPVKRQIAREVIARDGLTISTQVLQEFFVVAARILCDVDPALALNGLRHMAAMDVLAVTPSRVINAAELSVARRLSLWDSLLIVVARDGGCRVLVTEDLGHGDVIEGVRIFNPFNGEAFPDG